MIMFGRLRIELSQGGADVSFEANKLNERIMGHRLNTRETILIILIHGKNLFEIK